MSKFMVRSLGVLVALILTVNVVFADSPHFVRSSASTDSSGNLVVSFKEAGLGANETVTLTAMASTSALYQCFNLGGHHPRAGNKEMVTSIQSASGDFTSGRNGTINGSLTITPPGPGDFSCPNGQTLVLVSVSYSNVTIADVTNNVSQAIPGSYSVVLFRP